MARTGRPKVEIDLEQAVKLGELQCTLKEASAFLDIPEGTLANRPDFTSAFKKGQELGKRSLRRTQFKLAETSAAMAIWLGKQYLGQAEKIEVTNTELMREELVIIPSNGNHHYDNKNRLSRFIDN